MHAAQNSLLNLNINTQSRSLEKTDMSVSNVITYCITVSVAVPLGDDVWVNDDDVWVIRAAFLNL